MEMDRGVQPSKASKKKPVVPDFSMNLANLDESFKDRFRTQRQHLLTPDMVAK